MRSHIVIIIGLIVVQSLYQYAQAERQYDYDTDTNNTNVNTRVHTKSTGGEATAVSGGSTVSIAGSNDEDNFFSFATTFPQAAGCLGGAQGGASGSNGGGGFFGMHFINHDCWTSALAEAEASVDVRARLKCAGKHFRNAISFDQSGSTIVKQRYCVSYMIDKYTSEIEHTKVQVESAVDMGDLVPITEDMVIAANVTQEEFDEQAEMIENKNAQQQNQIDELKRRTLKAEARAAQAEGDLKKIQQRQLTKRQALQQLQQQVQQDYVITE